MKKMNQQGWSTVVNVTVGFRHPLSGKFLKKVVELEIVPRTGDYFSVVNCKGKAVFSVASVVFYEDDLPEIEIRSHSPGIPSHDVETLVTSGWVDESDVSHDEAIEIRGVGYLDQLELLKVAGNPLRPWRVRREAVIRVEHTSLLQSVVDHDPRVEVRRAASLRYFQLTGKIHV